MAYKKYIQKNGKLYGPYIYHSKRVDGKVISEYRGSKRDFNYKTFLFISAGVVLLIALLLFFVFSNNGITGNVVLGVDTSYEEGKPLDGVLKFSLKEGELLPENSKVIIENYGKTYEFVLKDVLNEESLEGNYYIYNKEIQGRGLGYGIEGERVIYPEVEFTIQIYNEVIEEEVAPVDIIPEETIEPVLETTETILETEDSISETIEPASQTISETLAEESSPTPITGNVVGNSGGFLASLFGMTGMVSLELKNEVEGITSKDKPFVYDLKEGETAELKPKSVRVDDEEIEDDVVSLKIEDGKAIVNTDYSKIEKGYGEDYIGEKSEVFSLDLSNLNLVLEEGDLKIKLVYEEEEIISLTTLLEEGEKISEEIIIPVEEESFESNETIVKNITVPINKTIANNITLNITAPPVLDNVTLELPVVIPEEDLNNSNKNFSEESETIAELVNASIWNIGDFLSPEERKILLDNFGEIEIKSTKSELHNGRIIRNYSFDKYFLESSYDSSLSRELLEVNMEKDRVKFLKNIASSL